MFAVVILSGQRDRYSTYFLRLWVTLLSSISVDAVQFRVMNGYCP